MAKQEIPNQDDPKRSKVSQTEFPNNTLAAALRIAQAIWDNFAGRGAAPHQIAMAIDMSPTSGTWRNLCGSSIAYGLTEGGYAAPQITLTDLGRRIVAPTEEGDDANAMVEAVLQPRIEKEFFERYNKAKFPKQDIGQNVLVSMGLPKDRAPRAFDILQENGNATGIILDTKSGPFVAIDNPAPVRRPVEAAPDGEEDDEPVDPVAPTQIDTRVTKDTNGEQLPKKKQLFVAHGKNHKPLDDLKKILQQLKIPHKVAVDEANAGRPISKKVADLMHECTAGIFIFTRDEKFSRDDDKGNQVEVWRPSENVVYELGAANYLWDKKIIILREDGVNFPSDFSDLGYITFKDGELESKGMEILKELIAFELVTIGA
ncbi:MAG: TIR domain-containing protein [Propylenella sp.]